MSVDLVETRLGLRTPEMQVDSMACLQRIMAHAHVIQLCREHTPKNGKEGEFPLVVLTTREFEDISYGNLPGEFTAVQLTG